MGRPSHWTGNDSHDDGWAFPPPILFLHGDKKRTGRGRSKRKNASAGRSAQAQPSCRRRGMVGSPARQSGMETRCPWGVLWPGDVQGYPLLLFPLPLARWLMKASATGRWEHRLLRPLGQRVAKRNAWKEELVKCVLATQFSLAPAPRESAVKSAPHPAAPVGAPSQTRRHHLTPTPVQRLCTYVQSCDQAPFSLPPGAAHSLFGQDQKENGGRTPCGSSPLREQRLSTLGVILRRKYHV